MRNFSKLIFNDKFSAKNDNDLTKVRKIEVMQIIRLVEEMQRLAFEQRAAGSVGLVPTMGALHQGHLKLVERARAENDRLVASIFVNPLQFGPSEDLERYPRPFERDCELLQAAGCDIVFAPDATAMYGEAQENGHAPSRTVVEVLKLGDLWEGAVRPGHLSGVATVVCKLFHLTVPTRAYFGEKDFQQLRVIQTMVRDLNFALEIVPCPTVREADGLALSSRNAYLSPEERAAAPVLYRALQHGVFLARNGEHDVMCLGEQMQALCDAESLVKIQYLTIVDDQTLQPVAVVENRPLRILVAAHLGNTRLIDNIVLQL